MENDQPSEHLLDSQANNNQSSTSEQRPSQSAIDAQGRKVIQPISGDLPLTTSPATATPVQPLSITQPSRGQAATPIVNDPASATPTPQTPHPNVVPVYPEATRGLSAAEQVPTTSAVKDDVAKANVHNDRYKIKVVLVSILGGYTTLSALLGLLRSSVSLSFGFVHASIELVVIDVIFMLVGIGLILRKELARAVYVFIAIIGLFFAIYGTYVIINSHAADLTNYDKVLYAQNITIDQQQISSLQKNQLAPGEYLTAGERQQQIQQFQKDIASIKKSESGLDTGRLYFGLIQGYLLAIIPIIFLTRPSVKEIFRS